MYSEPWRRGNAHKKSNDETWGQPLNLVNGVLNMVEGEKTRRRHPLGADFIRFWFWEIETLILFKKPCCI